MRFYINIVVFTWSLAAVQGDMHVLPVHRRTYGWDFRMMTQILPAEVRMLDLQIETLVDRIEIANGAGCGTTHAIAVTSLNKFSA
jgi:hypothetical protein